MWQTHADEKTNNDFYQKAIDSFTGLYDAAKGKNELNFALSLMPEFREIQGAGWNTTAEVNKIFSDYMAFIEKLENNHMKCRVMLSFYCHLAEASGFYEIPKNMLRIAEGKRHSTEPFNELVKEHRLTGEKIAPNANKVHMDLVGHAKSLGFDELAEVFRDAFDSDLRNGYAHADYIVWQDGIRLPKRNGGHKRIVPWEEFNCLFERAVKFFGILQIISQRHIESYNPPKTLLTCLGDDEERFWTIRYDPVKCSFGIHSGKNAHP